jgi:uncharacterized paraquat-inducible protein A
MNLPRVKKLTALLLLAGFVIVMTTGEAWACPTCKDGISGSDPVSVARATGYFYSILFMMAMPFVIIGTFGGAAYLSIRRAREQQAQDRSSASVTRG